MLDAIALEAVNRDSQKFVVYVQLIYPDDSFGNSSQEFQTTAKVYFACFADVFLRILDSNIIKNSCSFHCLEYLACPCPIVTT